MSAWTDAVVALSPDAYHRLGEASGATAADSSINGLNGTYGGTPTYGVASLVPSDAADTAVTLDATTEYVKLTAPVGTGDSVMFSYKGTGTGAGLYTWFSNPDAASADRCGLFIASGNVAIQYKGSTTVGTSYAASNLTNNVAHLVIVTFADGLQKLYVDGALVGSTAQTGTATATAGTRFGQYNTTSGHHMYGTYDEVAVFPTVVTDAEAADLYAAWGVAGGAARWWDGSIAQPASLLGWWDGASVQPASALGWWDGTTVQPLD